MALQQTQTRRNSSAGAAFVLLVALLIPLGIADGAPPEFALSGLAPNDADVLIRIQEETPDDAVWTTVLGDFAGASIGAEALGHWQRVKAFCSDLSAAPGELSSPVSMLAIRFGNPAANVDWVLATRMHDPKICAEGLRKAGARVLGGGKFTLADSSLELRPCGQWLLASPSESLLAEEVKERALVNAISTSDRAIIDVVESLPRGAFEIVLRHGPPTSGVTAAAFMPTNALEAQVIINGEYESSPLPSRSPSKMDLRMLPRLAKRSAMVICESGIGLLDPFVVRLGALTPAIIPPAELRRALASQRLLVLDGEMVQLEGRDMMEAPVACVAVPFREGSEIEVVEIEKSIDSWMGDVGTTLNGMISSGSEDPGEEESTQFADGGVKHVGFGPELVRALDGHPVGHATSLNWLTCSEASGRRWLLIATSPGLAQRVGTALGSLPSVEGDIESESEREGPVTCTAGLVRPEALAGQVNDLSTIRLAQGDASSESDAKLLASIAAILSGIEQLEWQFTRQDETGIKGSVNVRLPEALSGEEAQR